MKPDGICNPTGEVDIEGGTYHHKMAVVHQRRYELPQNSSDEEEDFLCQRDVLPVSPCTCGKQAQESASMDFSEKWSNLPKGPSLKNLTEGGFGVLKEAQHGAVQDLTKAHIESFDQAVTDGLSRVVQVSLSFCEVTNHLTQHFSKMR